MNYRLFVLFICVILSLGFNYEPAGALIAGSGNGQSNSPIHLADMRFPIEVAPAYPNSQVYRPGGLYGEVVRNVMHRTTIIHGRIIFWKLVLNILCLCAQMEQDIKDRTFVPAHCDDSTHWVVATENGTITVVGTYSVYLEGASGIRHRFLHMDMNTVTVNIGDYVTKGQRLGKVSNDFNGTPTTIHLHYDMYKYVSGVGSVYILLTIHSLLLMSNIGIYRNRKLWKCLYSHCTHNALGIALKMYSQVQLVRIIYMLYDAGITQGCAPNYLSRL